MARIGIYDLWINGGGGGEKKACVLAAHFSRDHEVWLIAGEETDTAALGSYFGVDLSRVRVLVPPRPILEGMRRLSRAAPAGLRRALRMEMLLKTADRLAETACYSPIKKLALDVLINCQWASVLPCPATRGYYMCMFPHPLKGAPAHGLANRLLGMPPPTLASYTTVTANSQFTSQWIRKLWDVEARVVYSTGERMGPAAVKEKIILNVGRFVGAGRADDKHQTELLAAFLRMEQLHHAGWQLHFAGTVLKDEIARQRARELAESARGRPVFFHFDAGFAELRELYRKASIYWHATGLGSSASEHPGTQEHFGVTTVEAMSAGAVPVVINTGGQKEIVTHAADGFLWNDLDQLSTFTHTLAEDPDLLLRLGRNAAESSGRFSTDAFLKRMELLLK